MILTNQAESGHLAYFAHLVDLLATCAEVSYRLTLLHSERPKLHRVLAVLNAIGLNNHEIIQLPRNTAVSVI